MTYISVFKCECPKCGPFVEQTPELAIQIRTLPFIRCPKDESISKVVSGQLLSIENETIESIEDLKL